MGISQCPILFWTMEKHSGNDIWTANEVSNGTDFFADKKMMDLMALNLVVSAVIWTLLKAMDDIEKALPWKCWTDVFEWREHCIVVCREWFSTAWQLKTDSVFQKRNETWIRSVIQIVSNL